VKILSHITTAKIEIQLKNESWIKDAISLMSKEFIGMTIEQKNADLIQVRYKPIEVYQTKGNLRFIKEKSSGLWSMQVDHWNCPEEVKKVCSSFVKNYQRAGVLAFSKKNRYSVRSQETEKQLVMVASRW
jgi:hypothetical protein